MKSIDITKIQPTNWRYILGLILVVIIVLAAIFIGTWLWGWVQGLGSKVVDEVI
jgi:sterol desaturase/sphingolipid hydroxylase (fatty acid hydroxylase superfamily)